MEGVALGLALVAVLFAIVAVQVSLLLSQPPARSTSGRSMRYGGDPDLSTYDEPLRCRECGESGVIDVTTLGGPPEFICESNGCQFTGEWEK